MLALPLSEVWQAENAPKARTSTAMSRHGRMMVVISSSRFRTLPFEYADGGAGGIGDDGDFSIQEIRPGLDQNFAAQLPDFVQSFADFFNAHKRQPRRQCFRIAGWQGADGGSRIAFADHDVVADAVAGSVGHDVIAADRLVKLPCLIGVAA